MGRASVGSWAQARLEAGAFLDEDGEAWLRKTIAGAATGTGPTWLDLLVDAIDVRGCTVELA